jgi:hypothetical protein
VITAPSRAGQAETMWRRGLQLMEVDDPRRVHRRRPRNSLSSRPRSGPSKVTSTVGGRRLRWTPIEDGIESLAHPTETSPHALLLCVGACGSRCLALVPVRPWHCPRWSTLRPAESGTLGLDRVPRRPDGTAQPRRHATASCCVWGPPASVRVGLLTSQPPASSQPAASHTS